MEKKIGGKVSKQSRESISSGFVMCVCVFIVNSGHRFDKGYIQELICTIYGRIHIRINSC